MGEREQESVLQAGGYLDASPFSGVVLSVSCADIRGVHLVYGAGQKENTVKRI